MTMKLAEGLMRHWQAEGYSDESMVNEAYRLADAALKARQIDVY